MGPRVGLDDYYRDSNSGPSAIQPVASRHTDSFAINKDTEKRCRYSGQKLSWDSTPLYVESHENIWLRCSNPGQKLHSKR
jgi:hypothetical protein